jgi:hypothetical protein
MILNHQTLSHINKLKLQNNQQQLTKTTLNSLIFSEKGRESNKNRYMNQEHKPKSNDTTSAAFTEEQERHHENQVVRNVNEKPGVRTKRTTSHEPDGFLHVVKICPTGHI